MIKTGIYNLVTDGYRWRHLLFYEKDTPIDREQLDKIHGVMARTKTAYIVYTTSSGGYHIMGLSPLSTISWAYGFKDLDIALGGNCSGHVLRVNLKANEEQKLERIGNIHDFPLCDNIYKMCNAKWHMTEYYLKGVTIEKWKSLFCLYDDITLVFRPRSMKRYIRTPTLAQRRKQSMRDKAHAQ